MITAGTKSELDAGSPSDGPAVTATTWRVNSVDLLRGVVMVIMLLDHTREFVHRDVLNFEATDLTRTNVLLFFTRWITHFCAPIFVFLAGTGAFLQMARGKSKTELSGFLVKRGLWLILLELTLIRVVVWFNLDFHFALMLQVIWVIGVSMVALAALIHLPLRLIAIVSVALIALHNLLDVIRVDPMQGPGFRVSVWMALHQPGVIFFTPTVYGLLLYPLIPWIGVLAAGYTFGAFYQIDNHDLTNLKNAIAQQQSRVSLAGRYVPEFATGGVVPGPWGVKVPVMAHAGEVVLNRAQQQKIGYDALAGAGVHGLAGESSMAGLRGTGGQPTVIDNHINFSLGTDTVDKIVSQGITSGTKSQKAFGYRLTNLIRYRT